MNHIAKTVHNYPKSSEIHITLAKNGAWNAWPEHVGSRVADPFRFVTYFRVSCGDRKYTRHDAEAQVTQAEAWGDYPAYRCSVCGKYFESGEQVKADDGSLHDAEEGLFHSCGGILHGVFV